KGLRAQIDEVERRKRQLEEENPKLISMGVPGAARMALNALDPATEIARVKALEAKIEVLKSQFTSVRAEAAAVADAESGITQLQRKKEVEDTQYRSF